ncbi:MULTISPECIES: restriction endonuclease subunit S [Burkholderia cepacia complex]|uniref:restriction endonuclease subunit S n=1 Tax=Burkholderia cepacia complex TaxID=87882 RepID=UPI001905018C|nr:MULTISPECIES: restriction endonuclease subunit S [Burkholderia cepacia complex]MBJ9733361.1 restriction endonuclease subunit S [Burkholderia cenocepacia]MBR8053378.1 restriction endonuclease subunit S [Burkholderia vietnamiensis]
MQCDALEHVLLRDLLLDTKDGEWGSAENNPESIEMLVVRGTDFDDVRHLDLRTVPSRHILQRHAARKTLRAGDILIETAGGSRGRPTGRTVFLRDELFHQSEKPITCASFARFLRFDNSKVDSEYVYWWLQSLYQSGVIETHQVQHSGIARFQFTKFADEIRVPLPARDVQRFIVKMLGALERRVTVLRQTNATLESIAQALFKTWFINFDPVRAKAEGREPQGMDAKTAALFPDSFEDSALGEIPKGWRVGDVYDIATVRYGAPFASKLFNTAGDGLPLVRIRDLKDEAPGVWTPESHPKGYKLQPGDIVVGMDGEFRAYLWGGDEAWMNQRICVFQPVNGHSAVFVRCSIMAPLAHVEATETATTVIHLGKGDIDRFRILVPPQRVASAFAAIAEPHYNRIVAGKQAMRSLRQLRDTLLPRLISGKLRLPEAEVQLNEALA